MKQKADAIIGYAGPNPFSDVQARSFSDEKVAKEFYPTSSFWTLFNDQHEVLIGRRGSGKTFLLKMMRQSMLKTIGLPKAQEKIEEKKYWAFYVPMQLEIVSKLSSLEGQKKRLEDLFCFFFNSILAESILNELSICYRDNSEESIMGEIALSRQIYAKWYNSDEQINKIHTFDDVIDIVRDKYYSFDLDYGKTSDIPTTFRRQLCSPLILIKKVITSALQLNDPTFIVCVDEAEFLNENMLKCINSLFRSSTDRIIIKIATLPYYYSTTETQVAGVCVFPGDDFVYHVVDMESDSEDYIQLTNKLCEHRLSARAQGIKEKFTSLEDFLGKLGNDLLIDYYRKEVGDELATKEAIESGIINSFSKERQKGAPSYTLKRKTIYDKFAPIYFVRQMYKQSQKGHSIPGWYAGANIVRKITDGNPRLFIQLMNALFEKARETHLTPKAQHEAITRFAKEFCDSTQAIEKYGPLAHENLQMIGMRLHKLVHDGPLVSVGCQFKIKTGENSQEQFLWLKEAIAYSRVNVSESAMLLGLDNSTKYTLSFLYAVNYWLPMRKDVYRNITLLSTDNNSYIIRMDDWNKKDDQMTLFEGDCT